MAKFIDLDQRWICQAVIARETGSYLLNENTAIPVRYFINEINSIEDKIENDIPLNDYEFAVRVAQLKCSDPEFSDMEYKEFDYSVSDSDRFNFGLARESREYNMVTQVDKVIKYYKIPIGAYLHLLRTEID